MLNITEKSEGEAAKDYVLRQLIYRTKLGRKFGRRRFFILTGIPLMLLHRNAWQGFTTAILLYRCKIVIDELDRVHAGGRKEDVSEETRNVIEKLTGIS